MILLPNNPSWSIPRRRSRAWFFFFNDTATTEIYTLSLHDALPISRSFRPTSTRRSGTSSRRRSRRSCRCGSCRGRKSTRLNSSHLRLLYAVFSFEKKKPVWHIFQVTWLRWVDLPDGPAVIGRVDLP